MEYKKFKDKRPEDTINFINNAFHNIGIETVYSFNPESVEGCYSNRVTVMGTNIGANGKGTSQIYALASGYAELAERLQNNLFYVGSNSPALYDEFKFYFAPDERVDNVISYSTEENSFMKWIYELNGCNSFMSKSAFLSRAVKAFNELWHMQEDDVLTVPFYSVRNKRIEYIPYPLYSKAYGSNGMSAGNTIQEALVQGLSEIYERYVNRYILENDFTPPDVPRAVIQKSKLNRIIIDIESSGQYKVIVKDLSLGGKYPVVGTIIIDTSTGKFGFRLGAHPSFEVALERTLTEAFQGRSIKNFTTSALIGTNEQAEAEGNIAKIFRNGEGYYRTALFGKVPSCEYCRFDDVANDTNKSLAEKMLEPGLKMGYDILVRNSGFLGLPALQIIIPGMSHMMKMNDKKIKFINTVYKISSALASEQCDFEETAKRIMRAAEYMLTERLVFNMQHVRILSRPMENLMVNSVYDVPVFLAYLFFAMGETEAATAILSNINADEDSDADMFIRGIKLYIQQADDGQSGEKIDEIIHQLYSEKMAHRICKYLSNPMESLKEFFAKFKCWDCDNCSISCCKYKGIYSLMRRLRVAMADNMPLQKDLAVFF